MKMRKTHCARLKHAKGQIFTCGMFGTCSDSVLSPRTPPPALVISNPIPTNAVAPAPSPVKIQAQNQNQQQQIMSPCSIPSPDTVSQEKLISQWDFGLKQQQQQQQELLQQDEQVQGPIFESQPPVFVIQEQEPVFQIQQQEQQQLPEQHQEEPVLQIQPQSKVELYDDQSSQRQSSPEEQPVRRQSRSEDQLEQQEQQRHLQDPERFKERYVGLVDRDLSPLQQQLLNAGRTFIAPPPPLLPLKDEEPAVDLSNVEALCKEVCSDRFSKMILRSLRHQADEDDEKKSKIVASGAVDHLIRVLSSNGNVSGELSTSREAAIRREALALLSVLADDEQTQRSMAECREQVLQLLQRELNRRSADAWVLLCKASTNEELINGDGNCTGVLDSCVSLLKDPSAEAKLVRLALKAMLGICLSRGNRSAAVQAGAVDALLATLIDLHGVDGGEFCNRSGIVVNVERALATLELLCTTPEGRTATISQPGCISELVGLVLGVSERATEYAAGVLCSVLCDDPTAAAAAARITSKSLTIPTATTIGATLLDHGNTIGTTTGYRGSTTTGIDQGDSVQEIAVKGGAPAQMLLVMQSECSERARRKAAKLLKALHKYGEDHTSTLHSDLASTITY